WLPRRSRAPERAFASVTAAPTPARHERSGRATRTAAPCAPRGHRGHASSPHRPIRPEGAAPLGRQLARLPSTLPTLGTDRDELARRLPSFAPGLNSKLRERTTPASDGTDPSYRPCTTGS